MNDVLQQAREDADSVIELASALIRTPSRGGIDDYGPVLAVLEDWLTARHLPRRRLHDDNGALVGIVVEIPGGHPGPVWVLDACLDTAPFGDESAWSFPSAGGEVVDGWLQGRGSADSKTAAAMFCHLAAALAQQAGQLHGSLAVLLDCDEHTGGFGGARAYLSDPGPEPVAGVMIGYPGMEDVVVGGRGVFRARLHVHGTAAHSGGSRPTPANAAVRAAHLVTALDRLPMPRVLDGGFPLPPKVTVTELRGGEGFTAVPDHATVGVDIRLTDTLDAEAAAKLLHEAAAELDASHPGPRPTVVEPHVCWPPFRLTGSDQPAAALLAGALRAGITARPKVAGPSNIGNLLAGLGIPATAGFGLPYEGLHGTDERVRLEELPQVQAAHHYAVLSLLGAAR